MDDWMTPEEKSIIIPNIMGGNIKPIHDLKAPFPENYSGREENEKKLTQVKKPKFTFETGSTYDGEWDVFGMSGKGVFKMFNGVYYVGEMEDGMLHGKGTIWYPNCCRLEGAWKRGILQQDPTPSFIYNDNLQFEADNWDYCTGDDKRFLQEIRYGINPTGRTLLSATVPPKQIPPGCYDTGDGFYSPLTKCVYNAEGEIIRIPKRSEEKFIMDNYRKSAGVPSYHLPGVHPFPQEWSEPVTSDTKDVDKEMMMEEDMFSTEKEDDVTKQNSREEKCVGRFNLLEKDGDERKFQMIDETESVQNIAVDVPVLKVPDRKLIIDPNADASDSYERKEVTPNVRGNKLALLMNVFKRIDEVGGPHLLTKEDCKNFQKQLAVHMSKTDDANEVEMRIDDIGADDEDSKERNDTYKIIGEIVDDICIIVLQGTDQKTDN